MRIIGSDVRTQHVLSETMHRQLFAIFLLLAFCVSPAHAQLRGHGGPVRALTISPDGKTAISGSFDSSAIRWSLQTNTAEQVLRFHDGAVNAVSIASDGRIATGGVDGRIAVWQPGEQHPQIVFEGHTAPVVALAFSPDGMTLASASWDRTARLWSLVGGSGRLLEGHEQNVNAVEFMPDGRSLVTAGYDATVRIWSLFPASSPIVTALPTSLNAAAVTPDGEIVTAGADGNVYFLSAIGALRGNVRTGDSPVVALAVSRDGAKVAVASVRGSVAIIERISREVVRTLTGPGLPVWSIAFFPDNHTLLIGGADPALRRWDTVTDDPIDVVRGRWDDPLSAFVGDPGAEVFRACVACHTLKPTEHNRAGPTLAGLFGRRIATLPGYNFSPALKNLSIVWTPETVSRLFELGPATYTPGTKMPEQRITSAKDRMALVKFLEKATK
jgi:cytochrome c